ncbi:MAG: hypothetical protein PHQ74_14180 [Crocinitomicaceae bacterium]|nr:hypothetical protein [Crocinitomicaceae bacterium]
MKVKLLLLVLIILCSSNMSFGQVTDGVLIASDSLVKKTVVSKSRYKFIPELNKVSTSQLTFYERFDSLSRIVEEKDLNSDGTMYAWSFFEYDDQGNVVKRKILNGDSTLVMLETINYDQRNRQTFRIGIDPDNKIRFQSNHIYQKDSIVYCGWFDDSTNVSTYIYQIDSTEKKIKETHYHGKGEKKVKFYESHFQYKDTMLHQKQEFYLDHGKIRSGTEYEYDKIGNVIQEYDIDSSGKKHLKEITRYDLSGNKEYLKGFKDNKVSYVYRWFNQYDSLQRPIKTIKYCDTLAFKPYAYPSISEITFEYREDYLGRRTEIKTAIHYLSFGDRIATIQKTSVNFDSQGLWINTTETLNGELTKYRYANYTFKEEP